MSNILNNGIIQHELRQVIYSRKSWLCLAALLSIMALIFKWLLNNYLRLQSIDAGLKYGLTEKVIHPYYAWLCLIALLLIPTITTQSLCAERANKTIVNYYMSSVTAWQVILSKFLALNFLFIVILFASSLLPLTVLISGSIDIGQFAASLLGAYLMLSAALAIGLACSSWMTSVTRSTIAIFISILAIVMLEWAAQFAGKNAMFLQTFGLLNPLKNFLAGVISLQNLAYYLFLISSSLMIASRRFALGRYDV